MPVDRDGRVDVAAFAAGRRRRRPGQPDDRQPRGRHRCSRSTEVAAACQERGVPLHTDAAQSAGRAPGPGRLVAAVGQRAQVGRPARGRRARRPHRHPLAQPAAGRRARARPRARLRERAGRGRRRRRAAGGARRGGGREHPAVRAGRPDPGRGRRAGCRTSRWSDRPTGRLPHLVTFSCLYVDGEALLHELDRHGFAVSSGSSCTSSTLTPSHVLEAMGVLSHGNVRVSLHRDTTEADVDRFLAVLPGIVADLPEGARGPVITLDQRGRRCPLPIIELARHVGRRRRRRADRGRRRRPRRPSRRAGVVPDARPRVRRRGHRARRRTGLHGAAPSIRVDKPLGPGGHA